MLDSKQVKSFKVDCAKWLGFYLRAHNVSAIIQVYAAGKKEGFTKAQINAARAWYGSRIVAAEEMSWAWNASNAKSIDTACHNKIYKDGDYTLCSRCKKAHTCKSAKRCFNCNETVGVFYHRSWDVFTCSKCLHDTEERFEREPN